MNLAPYYCYGLYVPTDVLEDFYKDEDQLETVIDKIESEEHYLTNNEHISATVFRVNEDGSLNFTELDDYAYILPCERMFNIFKQTYTSKEELVRELKDKWSDVLPMDYDYTNNIVYASGII